MARIWMALAYFKAFYKLTEIVWKSKIKNKGETYPKKSDNPSTLLRCGKANTQPFLFEIHSWREFPNYPNRRAFSDSKLINECRANASWWIHKAKRTKTQRTREKKNRPWHDYPGYRVSRLFINHSGSWIQTATGSLRIKCKQNCILTNTREIRVMATRHTTLPTFYLQNKSSWKQELSMTFPLVRSLFLKLKFVIRQPVITPQNKPKL